MKRSRTSLGLVDAAEAALYSPRKKSAESVEGSPQGGSGIGDWPSSPQLPLTRLDGSFSPRPVIQRPSAPLPIRPTQIEDSENYAAMMSFSPQHFKMPICSTPEEVRGAFPPSPPPRPHKTSPNGSTASKLAHPQPQVVHMPLQELMNQVLLPAHTVRRLVSSTGHKNPNRPKPQLGRSATMADVSRKTGNRSGSALLSDATTPRARVGLAEPEMERPKFGSPATGDLSKPRETTPKDGGRGPSAVRARSESNVARDVTIDPSVGKGMFHQATLSKLAVRPTSEGKYPQAKQNRDEWIEGRRYDPYELVRDAHKSARPSRAPRDAQVLSPQRQQLSVVITPPFRSTKPQGAEMASPNANMSSAPTRLKATRRSSLLASPPLNSPPLNSSHASHDSSVADVSLPFDLSDEDDELPYASATADSLMQLSHEVMQAQRSQLIEARPFTSSFSRISSSRRLNNFDATTFDGQLPFSQPEVYDDLANSTRDQLFAMEMSEETTSSTATPFARTFSTPGPSAW